MELTLDEDCSSPSSDDVISQVCSSSDAESAGSTRSDEHPNNVVMIRTYKRRWFILAVLSLLVFSNSMSRIAFGPVAYTSATFYESEIDVINWFAIVYMIVGIPCGLVATWVMDRIGLRCSLLLAAWIHCAGCVIRLISAIDGLERIQRIPLVFFGHVLSAIAQPFLMFAPTKLAAVWFPDNQRAIANTIATMHNPLGIMVANILSPLIVRKPSDIRRMLIVYASPAVLGAILASVGIWSRAPPLPPSASAGTTTEPFWTGIKQLVRNRQYWIIFVSIGGGIGIYTALTVFLEQILCPWGYTDFFAGVVCGTCLVLGGVVGALIAGIIADRTKRFVLVTKVTYVLCICSVAMFSIVQNLQNQSIFVALSCGLIGFFGLPLLPLGNEIVAEITYPVETATSSGLVFLSGQLQGMLLILVSQNIAKPVAPEYINITRCRADEEIAQSGIWDKPIQIRDMTIPCYALLGYSGCICLLFLVFFRADYRRMLMERSVAKRTGNQEESFENHILPSSSSSSSSSGCSVDREHRTMFKDKENLPPLDVTNSTVISQCNGHSKAIQSVSQQLEIT